MLAGNLGIGADRAADVARAIIDRTLRRLPDDMRRYLRAVDFMACDGCELCDDDTRDLRRDRGSGRGGVLRRPIRLGD